MLRRLVDLWGLVRSQLGGCVLVGVLRVVVAVAALVEIRLAKALVRLDGGAVAKELWAEEGTIARHVAVWHALVLWKEVRGRTTTGVNVGFRGDMHPERNMG